MLQGYLTQRSIHRADGNMYTAVEVTAEEFFSGFMPNRVMQTQPEAAMDAAS
jgi:hypothetical protein